MRHQLLLVTTAVLAFSGCRSEPEPGEALAFRNLSALSPAANNLTLPARITSLDTYRCAQAGSIWGAPLKEEICKATKAKQEFVLVQYKNLSFFRLERAGFCVTVGLPSGGHHPLALGHCGQGNAADELFFFAKETPTPDGLEAEIRSTAGSGADLCLQAGFADHGLRVGECKGQPNEKFLIESFWAFEDGGSGGDSTADTSGAGTEGPPPPPDPPAEPGPCPLGESCCLGEPDACILCMPEYPGCP